MTITRINPFSGETNTMDIDVTQDQIDTWKAGQPIQYAMPDLSADEREFIMTGITPGQYDELFPEK